METIIILMILIGIAGFIFGDFIGYERGYKAAESMKRLRRKVKKIIDEEPADLYDSE